jgi:hypothetical protein
MRIAGPSLALSLVLLTAPALAQAPAGPAGPDMQQNQPAMGQGRYEIVPSQQTDMQQGPMQQGPMQQGQMNPGMMRQHQRMMQQMHSGMQGGAGTASGSFAQSGQANSGIVTFSTRGKIKESLEQSGFKHVQVLPQAYLIRATAPDGSRVVMQVSPEGLYGVVVNHSDQEGSGGSIQGGGPTNQKMIR